jgi:hypothetical protein
MNYAQFKTWTQERVEDLVQFGVPRAEAEEIMSYVEVSGINAESAARKDNQFLLDFARLGSQVLAERHGCTGQAIRQHRTRILNKKQRDVALKVAS